MGGKNQSMKIIEHRLTQDDDTPYPFKASPNIGSTLVPDLIIVHFTAGQTLSGAVQWLINPKSAVSSHLVIGKDGEITQLVPFNRVAWHAGTSAWKGRSALNRYSIGIELDYPGPLTKSGDHWVASFKKDYPDTNILVAKAMYGARTYGWLSYPDIQVETTIQAAVALFQSYKITEILGHEEIAPGRKWDPGPAFPWDYVRSEVQKRLSDTANP
jgi:N-acetylmuramoyl-L-alanine amidase